uniref:DLG associated protein 2 n=1 Tax=Molossus molossus TaxID=27622 RepID=A0A7J8GKU9_MOLMO|nr:DLG associated protein 2 [Molossus molossus]
MGTAQVLPGILQKHCCLAADRNTESQCTLCGEPEDEESGDLVQPGISFPGPAEEDLGRVSRPSRTSGWGPSRRPQGTCPPTHSLLCSTQKRPT